MEEGDQRAATISVRFSHNGQVPRQGGGTRAPPSAAVGTTEIVTVIGDDIGTTSVTSGFSQTTQMTHLSGAGTGSTSSVSAYKKASATSITDEQEKMEEKRKAYELKQARQEMEEITGGDPWRLRMDRIMEHGAYQGFMTVCTFGSFTLVAMEADYHSAGLERTEAMNVLNAFLIAVFAIDIIAKVYVYQRSFVFFAMNVFELSLLAMDLVLQFWPGLPRIAAALKVLRFIRMTRILKSVTDFRELYLMMMGIAASLRAIIFGAMILFLATTIFAVCAVYFVAPICHDLYEVGVFADCDDCAIAFDTVMSANLTFFKTIIAGDSWGQLAIPLINASTQAGSVLLGAWLVISLGLLNTIAGVIVDRQAQARMQDADYMATVQAEDMELSVKALMLMFKELDNEDRSLNEEALLRAYDESASFRGLLNRMDVHRSHVPVLFRMLDTDNTDDLTFPEFVHGLHNLKSEDSHTIAIFTKHYCETLLNKWNEIEDMRLMLKQHDKKFSRLCGNIDVTLSRLTKAEVVRENVGQHSGVPDLDADNPVHALLLEHTDQLSRIGRSLEELESCLEPYKRPPQCDHDVPVRGTWPVPDPIGVGGVSDASSFRSRLRGQGHNEDSNGKRVQLLAAPPEMEAADPDGPQVLPCDDDFSIGQDASAESIFFGKRSCGDVASHPRPLPRASPTKHLRGR
eukprot:TRINITY_DN122318_c0_g1_i1.p1 TRINITY_DN122318_c0_g1~~TRINITY_DN122318_c0_g1_i1.p1  ORF type:complete len:686 (+),score=139.96 TRINITY_DN122318_c0_g1_i1:185-2242(+)